ncbi:rhodanese-like domain-containing protein [Marinoscillum pacificum]|uniref:rhodanese-like domain-containing protein n=1 Tax=Marinoscillum pacificum TaxID=392723 RepID=UPI002157C1FD|nr:rhodanese-like domain-containing protein [Marinoscillum pacificum]
MKSSIRPLGIIILSLFGFLLIVSFYADKSQFELTAKEMHGKVLHSGYRLDSTGLSQLVDPILIDIRNERSFLVDHLDHSVNVPLSQLLNDESLELIGQSRPKVIISDERIHANESWMLLTQMGYDSIFVYRL